MGWHAKKVRANIYPLIAEIAVSKDSPGFIANAILMPMLNEAILVLEKVRSTSP
jgi:3-hydroxyacyl-CoA dehydrogenase